jgi:hypothetical protein
MKPGRRACTLLLSPSASAAGVDEDIGGRHDCGPRVLVARNAGALSAHLLSDRRRPFGAPATRGTDSQPLAMRCVHAARAWLGRAQSTRPSLPMHCVKSTSPTLGRS